ncbi:concanavalin A-like lectin/glucanase domain-containing protein, partial [Exophiala viscosa]
MPSSSLFLGASTTLVSALTFFAASASAASSTYYALDTEYSGSSFFDGFTFFDEADPSHGFVTYVDEDTASSSGLITFDDGSVQMRVDDTHTYNGSADYYNVNGVGRPSVRISSNERWTHGLFIADVIHLPTTTTSDGCSVWPAFWTLGGGTWPSEGEVDIIEGSNIQAADLSSAHTGGTCTVSQSSNNMTGISNGDDCDYYDDGSTNGAGCGAFDGGSDSYSTFNDNGGGVYAMLWTSDAIKVYFFPRGSIPSDISSGKPDPTGWGLPFSIFNGPDCDIDSNFQNHQIVFDTTFCGDLAGATWTSSGCAAKYGDSCSVYNGDNPTEFSEAYWDVNYVKVY